MAKSNFATISANLKRIARKHGSAEDTQIIRRVLNQTASFLVKHNAIKGNPEVGAIENLTAEAIPMMNREVKVLDDISVDAVFDFVQSCKVPTDRIESVSMEVLRILDSGVNTTDILEQVPESREHISMESYAGRGGAMMLSHDNKVALEAFGADIDRLQSDNRLNIVMTVLRSFTSIVDKLLPRVAEEGNVVTIKIPSPEVYNLAASMNASASVRNNPANRQPMVTLYRQPDPVSTALKQIVPLSVNDTNTVKSLYDNTSSLATGVSSNLFDLSSNAAVFGYNAIDYTDLVAPGGKITNIYVLATHTTTGGVVTTELYRVPTSYYAQAMFVGNPNNMDSGDQQVIMSSSYMVRRTSTTAANVVTTMFSTYTDGVIQLNLQFNADLNLKTAQIAGNGTVNAVLNPILNGAAPSTATATDFALITWNVVAYDTELFYDEENMRKTTTAIRMNYMERQFVIPMGKNFIVDYALNQQSSEDVAAMVNTAMSLGNSARNLAVITSRLTDMAAAIAFEQANPEMAPLVNSRMNSVAGTLCIPYVVTSNLDYGDNTIAVMRESERLSELHGRLRARMLSALTTLCNNSLYINNLMPGEKPVFKVLTEQPICDQLFGILDYHNELADKIATANGADYSMELPNGYRIDIVKTNFIDYANTITVIPVRESDPEHITSFGTIRDRGTYVAQYTPINNGGVARRVVSNSREIVFATNIIGVQMNVLNLPVQLGQQT